MNQWQNSQAPAMFAQGAAGHLNPSMYNNLAGQGGGNPFDVNQFGPGIPNGSVSSQAVTPQPQAFGGPQNFSPASVVPAKRPHDGMSGSPQPPNPASRSQTPANPYSGFPNQQQQQQQQQGGRQFPNVPTPYQHLQQQPGSNNASPSPIMQNQQFRPPPPQQQQQSQQSQQQQPSHMNNSSPSPFPQQSGPFGGQVPGTPTPNPQQSQQQQQPQQQQHAQMAQFNQQFGLNPAMAGMAGMPGQMAGQMNNMANMNNAQRAYQMKLMQHQQQLHASGMMRPRLPGGQPNPMNPFAGAQPATGQMANGQNVNPAQAQMQAQAQAHQIKRTQFMQTLQKHATQQGRPFNQSPTIGGKPVDLFALWTVVTTLGGSQQVERMGQWQTVATKMGFHQQQFPPAAEELKNLHHTFISQYERLWFKMRMAQQQETARMHAQQMAGFAGAQQASPTKMMQPPAQQTPFSPFPPSGPQAHAPPPPLPPQQQQQQQPPPPATPQSHGTPVQNTASMPPLDGMATPQPPPLMGPGAGMPGPRRNSSLKRSEPMTPQSAGPSRGTASPSTTKPQQRPVSSAKHDAGTGAVMRNDEPQSTHYVPQLRSIEWDGGYDVPALSELGNTISRAMPNMPSVDEMGVIDTKAITLSLASGIHGEVRYALDALVIVSHDQRVALNLEHCEDLLDVIADCAEDQIDLLSEEAVEVSDVLDLPSYEDVLRGSKAEADTLQDVPKFGTPAYDLDRAAEKIIAISTILRNTSFYEFNHQLLTSPPLIRWLSNTIRLLATRNMLLRTYYNTQDFYKDMIIFLSNVTQSLELPTRDDALHILHFLLAFAPQPSPSYSENDGTIRFTSFSPALHRYLPPAVDCLAKLLARQDPNRTLYRSIFSSSSSSSTISSGDSESPLHLLTRTFALAISVLPDRTKGASGNSTQLRIVEARKAYLTQGMLAADILTTLAPSNDRGLARAWIESEDGWAVGLLNLAALLSVDRNQSTGPKGRELGMDTESFRLITHRALTMMKRLAEKAGKGSMQHLQRIATNGLARVPSDTASNRSDDQDDASFDLFSAQPRWEGIPQGHAILGALMMPNTDKVALGLLCGLHEMAMQPS